MSDEAKEILSRSLVHQISQLQTERDALRELLRECRSGWYLNEDLNARIDAALKGK